MKKYLKSLRERFLGPVLRKQDEMCQKQNEIEQKLVNHGHILYNIDLKLIDRYAIWKDEVMKNIQWEVSLPSKIMTNAKLLPNRDEALFLLPKGGVVAEVGVAYGDFSRKIIDVLNPDIFYAIDTYLKMIL